MRRAVEIPQDRTPQRQHLDLTGDTRNRDDATLPELVLEQDERPGQGVPDERLGAEADCDPDDTRAGDQRRERHANLRQHQEGGDDEDQHVERAGETRLTVAMRRSCSSAVRRPLRRWDSMLRRTERGISHLDTRWTRTVSVRMIAMRTPLSCAQSPGFSNILRADDATRARRARAPGGVPAVVATPERRLTEPRVRAAESRVVSPGRGMGATQKGGQSITAPRLG